MVASVRRARAMASAAARRSPETRVRSEASMATSVPVPDGEPEVGLGEGWGVVDAVAHHGHHLARLLEAPDLGRLAVGQHVGQHAVDAHLGGDGPGRALVVAGEQDRRKPERPQLGDGLAAGGLQPVGQSHEAHAAGPSEATATTVSPLAPPGRSALSPWREAGPSTPGRPAGAGRPGDDRVAVDHGLQRRGRLGSRSPRPAGSEPRRLRP